MTDASGLTLYLGGTEWLKAEAAEMNLVEGARCSETVNGTNSIGTGAGRRSPCPGVAFERFSCHHREMGLLRRSDTRSGLRPAHGGHQPLEPLEDRPPSKPGSRGQCGQDDGAECLLDRRRDQDARLRRRYGDLATKTSDLLVNRDGYLLIGEDLAHPKPLDIPENGGEIAMGDGSLAVRRAAGSGRGLSRPPARPTSRQGSTGGALERAGERAREPADERDVPTSSHDLDRTGTSDSGLPGLAAKEHLSAHLEAAIDSVIVADASGRIVEFNPAAERTFGYSRKEALGRTMAELIVPPSLRERHIAAFARFVKTREGSMLGRRVELTGMRADGSEFPVELALSQIEAEPVLICGALRDVSATKQAESHLRELAEEQAAVRQVGNPRRLRGVA